MTPEPAPEPCWVVTLMLTTLGETAAETAVQSGAETLPWTTVGAGFWFGLVVVVAAGVVSVCLSPSCVAAYVAPLAWTSSRKGNPTVWPKRLSRLVAGRLPVPSGGVGPAGCTGGAGWL